METMATRRKTIRESIDDWIDKKHRESRQRGRAYEKATEVWHNFCFAISYNYPWTVTGHNLDDHHIRTYPDRYMITRLFFPLDPEGLRSRITGLIAGQDVNAISQKDFEHVLALFTASLAACVGEHIVPDPPSHFKQRLVSTSKIEQWVSDAAKATGADALARAYFAGVPYDDLLDAEEQELYENHMEIAYNAGRLWDPAAMEQRPR